MNKRTLAFIAAFSAGLGISVVTAQPVPVGSANVNGTPITPSRVTTPVVDAGVLGINAPTGAECAIGIQATDNFRGVCWNRQGGASATGPYISYNAGTAAMNIANTTGNMSISPGAGSTLTINESITAGSTKIAGTITLAAGTGNATVRSGAVCVCTDTTANASVRCAVASTTLTATGTGTDVIAYVCM